jgi:hypothetical protein
MAAHYNTPWAVAGRNLATSKRGGRGDVELEFARADDANGVQQIDACRSGERQKAH